MPTSTFAYRARTRLGELVIGTLEADTVDQVESKLSNQDLIPVRIEQRRTKQFEAALDRIFRRVRAQDRIVLYRQLSAMYGAGVSFSKMLDTARKQNPNPRLRRVLEQVRQDVEEGISLSNAMARHPAVFDEVVVNMIAAGETGGILEDVLDRIGQMSERELEIRSKVRSATLYPKLVVAATVIGAVIVVYFLIPRLEDIYRILGGSHAKLPLPTRMLLAFSDLFTSYWYLAVLLVGAAIGSTKLFLSTPVGRYLLDKYKLRVWIFGPLFTRAAMARFSRIFGSLYRSGLPILQSLEIAGRALGNRFIAKGITRVRDSLSQGRSLEESLERAEGFTPMIQQMVSVGEEAGTLDRMLQKAGDYYDSEIDHSIRNLTTVLEPVLLLGLFAVVGFLAFSAFLPMWQLVSFTQTGGMGGSLPGGP